LLGAGSVSMRFAAAGIAALVTLLPGSVGAHDYWIEPVFADGASGATVSLRMLVGEALVSTEERELQRDRTVRLDHVSASGVADLLAEAPDGARPLVEVRLTERGGHLIEVERAFASIELPPDRFERYLRVEGLGHVVRERRRRGESDRPGRERYARCLSALVRVDAEPDEVFAHDAGCRLAMLPEVDPSLLARGDRLRFRVRFDTAPLADAVVDLYVRDRRGRVSHRRIRTDAEGRAGVRLPATGFAVLRTVTMVRSQVPDAADWESWWSSYSFQSIRP